MLKPAQTGLLPGEPGDVAEVARLAGDVTTRELARYPDPLAPATAASRAGMATVHPKDVAAEVTALDETHDLVLVEGAGGLLVRFDESGSHARRHRVGGERAGPDRRAGGPRHVELDRADRRGVAAARASSRSASWSAAGRCTRTSPRCATWPTCPRRPVAPLLGALPQGVTKLGSGDFLAVARRSFSPWFGGEFDPETFAAQFAVQ